MPFLLDPLPSSRKYLYVTLHSLLAELTLYEVTGTGLYKWLKDNYTLATPNKDVGLIQVYVYGEINHQRTG